jgi:ferritin-like metal-binding protein YciE
LAKAAESPDLQQAFTKHLRETEAQVDRLEQIFRALGEKPTGKRCKGMEGLVEEGKDVLAEEGEEAVLDAALIAAAQKVEHYEIATYGCLITYAKLLGNRDAEKLLKQTLAEEEATDEALSALGEGGINQAAVAAGQGEEEEEE